MLRKACKYVLLLTTSLYFHQLVSSERAPSLTFIKPYDIVDNNGKRTLGPNFITGGSAEVKKNFIRLTPDRQSKRGYIWSKNQIESNQLATVLTFRIHGQGTRWFGDGIGLWITHENSWKDGENHGFTDKYYGVGILLDTFVNTDHKGGHKDVTIQVNNGKKTLDELQADDKIGCDATFRYLNTNAAFDPVFTSSRLRIKIIETNLEVDIDAQSDGNWVSCHKLSLPFSKEWLKYASIGITASTGALADNHDILQLDTFKNDIVDQELYAADAEVWSHNYSKEYDALLDSKHCDNDCKINILQKYISNFHMESEHWMEELREQTENTIKKMREKEVENRKKIGELSKKMTEMLDQKVERKMKDIKTTVEEKIAVHVDSEFIVAQSSWRLPFFIILLAILGVIGVAYQKYQKLVKNHLL